MYCSSSKTALIVGATGLVGKELLQNLLKDPTYTTVTVLSRKPLSISHQKLTVHLIDFDSVDSYDSLITADHVFCCLGTTIKKAKTKENFYKVDYVYPTEVAKIAKFNGATLFSIVTAMGVCKHSTFYYNRVKGEVEEMVSHLQFKSCNIFRPSLLLGEREEFRLGEQVGKVVAKGLDFMMVGGLKKYRAIKAETVANAVWKLSKQQKEGINIFESDLMQEFGQENNKTMPLEAITH